MIARRAVKLKAANASPRDLNVDGGARLPARTIIIASGAECRCLCKICRVLRGVGVYYGATFIEAQLCGGEEVIVVGGGNSAGQAAVFLSQTAKHVDALIRLRRL